MGDCDGNGVVGVIGTAAVRRAGGQIDERAFKTSLMQGIKELKYRTWHRGRVPAVISVYILCRLQVPFPLLQYVLFCCLFENCRRGKAGLWKAERGRSKNPPLDLGGVDSG